MTLTLRDVAALVEGTLSGDGEIGIHGVAGVENAESGDLVALEDVRLLAAASDCRAAGFLVSETLAPMVERPAVVVPFPQVALNKVIERLGLLSPEEQSPPAEIHPNAAIHPAAELGEGCHVGAFAVIGEGAVLGRGTVLRPHAVVEAGAVLGDQCWIHPHAVIGSQAKLGNRVVVGAGAVVAATGFGWGFTEQGAVRLHHIGLVEVGDHAEIGPGCTIDRARFGITRIGIGAKLDSHVHVSHNCTVGDRTVVAAQFGMAGSSHIGANCLIGGQAGVTGHVKVAPGTQLAARTGVSGNLSKPGTYHGFWAKDRSISMRELAATSKLPRALQVLRELRARVAELEARLAEGQPQGSARAAETEARKGEGPEH